MFARDSFIDTFAADNRPEDMQLYLAEAYGEPVQLAEIVDEELVTVLAGDGGNIAAYAQMHLTTEAVQIKRFYVDKKYQGRGLAQSLMAEVEAIARAHGTRRLWLGVWERNYRAIAFYAKRGFRDVGSMEFVLGTDLQFDRIMEKWL